MHSLMKCSGCWPFPQTKCEHFHRSWPSQVQPTLCYTFCYFSPCLFCWAWFLRLKKFHPLETCFFWRSGWWACKSQLRENFWCRLSKNGVYLDVGLIFSSGESQVFCHSFRQYLLNSLQEMLWKKHSCSFCCEFLHTNMPDFALFDDVICSFVQWI